MDQAPQVTVTATILPSRPDTCSFTVNRTLHVGSVLFPDKASAAGSPLAEALFAIPGVVSLRLSGSSVKVTRETSEDWRAAASKIGAAIREHLSSGKPAVDPKRPGKALPDSEIRAKVQSIFDKEINPALGGHGGFVELLDVKEAKVFLRLGGGCQGCGMADVTLRQGIETSLRDQIPDIDEIMDTTDHGSGNNPYYAPSKK